jgi:hypothetical protein
LPEANGVQVPEELHTSHPPVHAVLQHTPSAQKPLAQSELARQDWPLIFTHAPDELQVKVPVQLSLSAALVTAVHSPG